jgi:hypothetical protein
MPLPPEELFKMALNVQDPWIVKKIDFSPDTKQLDIWIDFIPGRTYAVESDFIRETTAIILGKKKRIRMRVKR